MTDHHAPFESWLASGAIGDPPRDSALHATVCKRCLRLVAARDALAAIDIGRAALPPSHLEAGRESSSLAQSLSRRSRRLVGHAFCRIELRSNIRARQRTVMRLSEMLRVGGSIRLSKVARSLAANRPAQRAVGMILLVAVTAWGVSRPAAFLVGGAPDAQQAFGPFGPATGWEVTDLVVAIQAADQSSTGSSQTSAPNSNRAAATRGGELGSSSAGSGIATFFGGLITVPLPGSAGTGPGSGGLLPGAPPPPTVPGVTPIDTPPPLPPPVPGVTPPPVVVTPPPAVVTPPPAVVTPPPAVVTPPPTPVPTPVLLDSDGDGVPDALDQCPSVPMGPFPDPLHLGCPLPPVPTPPPLP